jgi:Ca-activated chloride channel family protein
MNRNSQKKTICTLRTIFVLLFSLILVLALSGCQIIELLTQMRGASAGPDICTDEAGLAVVDYYPAGAMPMEAFNTTEFSVIDENTWKSVKLDPFSTFAADVDTASYAAVRRYLLSGELPPADAVRVEELINYFHYDYPAPEDGSPFGVSLTLTDTPWNDKTKLLVVGVATEEIDAFERQPANFVFLIDVSGSMDYPDKLGLVKQAFLLLTEQLNENDTVSIVTYAGFDEILADGLSGSNKTEIMSIIENLEAGGSTHGSAGITTAYELAEKYYDEDKNNRVILATDGDLNIGITSEGELIDLITKKRETGVFLSVMGFGMDNLKDNKLTALANHGNGNYGYIDSVLEARKLLVEDMGGTLQTVAKDVKFQVEFNPNAVKGYRLVGYEDRLMNAEDFADDKKDGGEIGAGHRVTILYEIADLNSEQEIPVVTGKYEAKGDEIKSEFDNELLTVSIRYKEPTGDESSLLQFPLEADAYTTEADDNVRLASALAAFGMLLRDSEFKGDASYESVIETLDALPEKDEYVIELIYLVNRAAKLAEGIKETVEMPATVIDEIEALSIAREYALAELSDSIGEIDLNLSETIQIDQTLINEFKGLSFPLPGEDDAKEIELGDYLVFLGDTTEFNFIVLFVSGQSGEVTGYLPIEF